MPEFAPNPYLPDRGQQLAALLMSMGQGITASDMAGRGVLPGIGMGASLFSASQAQAQHDADKAWQWQQQQDMQKDYRKAQMGLAEERTAAMKRDAESKERMGGMLNGMLGFGVPPTQPTMGPGTFNTAIAGIESGGHADPYRAIGPETGKGRAYGKYQVMDFNVGPWTQEVLGRQMTPQEFLANDQAQEAVFNTKFGQYVKQYGNPQDAASMWFSGKPLAGNTSGPDVNGTTVAGYVNKFNRGLNPGTSQGAGEGVVPAQYSPTQAPPGAPSPSAIQQLDPALRATIAAVGQRDPEKAMQMLVTALQSQKKVEAWQPLTEPNAKMMLGQGYDPGKAYQRNTVTGEIKPIGGSLVNIDQKGQTEFAKEMGKLDAKRFGAIMESEGQLNDMASKIGFALDQFKQTYTGPGGEAANAFFKMLGAAGFEGLKDKANAADAGMAVINQMKPGMRAAGSGTSTDKDMDIFGKSLPSLLNMPGGNEKVAAYFQRLADRATETRRLAQEHSQGGTVPLSGTGFDDAVKKLGPLFSKEELAEMQGLAKAKPPGERRPLDQFGGDPARNMSPVPAQRRPLNAFGGQ